MSRLFDDTTSNYLTVSTPVITAYPFSMGCWFNVAEISGSNSLMVLSDVSVNDTYCQLSAAGQTAGDPVICSARNGAAPEDAETSTGYSANTDHHALGVWTSATDRVAYLDGGNSGSDAVSVAYSANIDTTSIGVLVRLSLGGATNGKVGEAAIWNVALDAVDAAILGAGFSPLFVKPESIVAYWPLIGGTGGARDLFGNDLSEVGTVGEAVHPLVIFPSHLTIGKAPAVVGDGSVIGGLISTGGLIAA